MLRRSLRAALPVVVLLSLLTACGGSGSSGAIDHPSITASFSPTGDRPTATRSPSRTPDSPETSAPGPSSGPTSELSTDNAPTSNAPTSNPPTSSEPAVESSPPEKATGGGSGDEEDTQSWWWLLIPLLAVAGVVAWLILRRSRSREAWEARLASAESEVGWFARDLIPQLRGSGSAAGVSGGWAVAAPRVTSLDDDLSQLITTAPGDPQRARALTMRDAVRTARDRVAAVAGSTDPDAQWSLDLDDAQAPLLAALVPPSDGNKGSAAP
jgi:hypothetical protein